MKTKLTEHTQLMIKNYKIKIMVPYLFADPKNKYVNNKII